MARYVLDTSAIMALILGEPESPAVRTLLEEASANPEVEVAIAFVVLMEVEYRLLRLGRPLVEVASIVEHVEALPATMYESTPEWRHQAARIKGAHRLSVADAWIAALALLLDAELVHKDPEFDAVAGLRALRL